MYTNGSNHDDHKAISRDRKRRKAIYGMKESGRSVKLLERIKRQKAESIKKKKG